MNPKTLDATTRVAVIGAGSMGAGIAQLAAQAGHEVRLFDMQPGAAVRALERIAADLDGAVQRGRMTAAERDGARERLVAVERLEALEGCGLAIEAIVEKLEPKQQLFRQLENVLGAQAVLATNTSSISVTAVAQGLQHPQRLIGLHFFNPATRMKLVEIIRGVETDPALVPALHALSQAWGKTPVDAPNAPGFIVNRVARPYYAEGLRLLAERVAPAAAVDKLLREAGGFAMGPFELMDLIGVEVNLSVTESVFQATAFDPRFAPSLIQQELVRSGRFGRKSGQGFHRYGADVPAPQVDVVAPASAAPAVACAADMGALAPLVQRLQAAGVALQADAGLPAETFTVGGVRVALTDGRTATERAATDVAGPLLLLDLARDFAATPLLGAAASVGAQGHLPALAAVLQAAGIALLALDDVAGLVLMRTVCCLANEAADVITWSGATARDIDVAMKLGTAYPVGPLAWADALGAARVATVLRHLQDHYGDTRYRRSPLLTRLQHAGGSFHA
ncbi:3-hydroxyacyl-CoA dehydrogenase [Azohydromonas lata]|uniref:3-hydroxyacyl-CoA dehydrogenase n=1 Tax=Azohydromonas lata TaxID=45677 RepID=A0ABU5ILH3_9BURK|nr:3-hydroxyacyl-CoA dehydrogenase [Azohydromonas lata]MDZ5459730.1 3-hydroxyacyl-CoA dehydrogenase [Azohydromonas lata]